MEVNFLDGTTRLKNLQMEIPSNQIVGKLDLDRDAWTGVVFLSNEMWNFLPEKYCTPPRCSRGRPRWDLRSAIAVRPQRRLRPS